MPSHQSPGCHPRRNCHAAAGTLRLFVGDAVGSDGEHTELSWAALEAPSLHLRLANADALCTPRCPTGWGSGAHLAINASMCGRGAGPLGRGSYCCHPCCSRCQLSLS